MKPSVVDISENAIFVEDFSEMQQIVSHLSVLPSAPPKINIRTRSAKKVSFDIIYPDPFKSVQVKLLVAVCSHYSHPPASC